MHKLTLDVIVAFYRKTNPELLLRSIKSVSIEQTLPPHKIILVYDGEGCEEQIDYIKKHYQYSDNLTIVGYSENKGPGFARNYGIQFSNADLIAISDADDISASERFEKQVSEFAKDDRLSLCGTDIIEQDNQLSARQRPIPYSQKEIVRTLKYKSPFNNMTVMFRKRDYLNVGGYPSKRTSEDYFLWGGFIKFGYSVKNIEYNGVIVNFSNAQCKNRRGLSVFMDDYDTQKKLLDTKNISRIEYYRNILIYFTIRLIPPRLTSYVYLKILRKPIKYQP